MTRLVIDTDDARRPAAEVDALPGDGRRAFQMHESSRYRILPEHAALVESQTVQDGAVGLVHAVAEDQVAVVNGGRTDGRQFQIRRRLASRRRAWSVFGSMFKQVRDGTLKPPSPETNR